MLYLRSPIDLGVRWYTHTKIERASLENERERKERKERVTEEEREAVLMREYKTKLGCVGVENFPSLQVL